MWGTLLVALAKPALGWLERRRARTSAAAKLATGEPLTSAETDALRVIATSSSWTDEYLLIWWTGMATYAAFGAPWGGDPLGIQRLLNDPVVLAFVGAVFGVRKFIR